MQPQMFSNTITRYCETLQTERRGCQEEQSLELKHSILEKKQVWEGVGLTISGLKEKEERMAVDI